MRAAAGGAKDPSSSSTPTPTATHQSVIHVMEAARLAGLSHITFATQTPDEVGTGPPPRRPWARASPSGTGIGLSWLSVALAPLVARVRRRSPRCGAPPIAPAGSASSACRCRSSSSATSSPAAPARRRSCSGSSSASARAASVRASSPRLRRRERSAARGTRRRRAGALRRRAAAARRAQRRPGLDRRDRAAAARAALAAHPDRDVVICDDGLQHYRLARDVEIAVDDERGFGNGCCCRPDRCASRRRGRSTRPWSMARRRPCRHVRDAARAAPGSGDVRVAASAGCSRRAARPTAARGRRHRRSGTLLRHARVRSASPSRRHAFPDHHAFAAPISPSRTPTRS